MGAHVAQGDPGRARTRPKSWRRALAGDRRWIRRQGHRPAYCLLRLGAAPVTHSSQGNARLPYPPPWMDTATLCAHICAAPNTVDNWVASGILPPPRKRGGKLMWKWAEVDQYLTNGADGADTLA